MGGKDQASAFSFEWMKYCSGEGHGNDGKDGAPQTIWTGVKSVTCGQDLTLTTPDQRGDAYRTDTTTHKIFFASDLCREEFEVDVREAKTGEQIPWSKAEGLNVIASGNDKWYVEKNFFIEELEKAETKRD